MIEDSAAGIASGLAAGVAVLGVRRCRPSIRHRVSRCATDLVGVDVPALQEILSAALLAQSVA